MSAYATGENRVWTTRDERDMRAEHKRITRATLKHLGTPPTEQDRTLLDKLLRRRTDDAEAPLNRRPLPPKAPQQDSSGRWWNRSSTDSGHRPSHSRTNSYDVDVDAEVRRAATVTGNTRVPPPIPPRYDLMQQEPPHRPRRKSEHDSAARQRARNNALKHLESDRGYRPQVVDRRGYVPPQLDPGTWIPGQLNAVPVDRYEQASYGYVDEHGLTTPQLYDQFPLPPNTLPPTQPLNVGAARQRRHGTHNIPIPPVPPMPDRSNRESFLELRKKRSYRV
ncbi:hypothetical protein BDV93DRAFT_513162 [Ceratobasidium sp. AG-I]|nr:hypothetical protein BDV93DRAFT_513162 [Ceratobasidium sp. AG-I]